MRADGRPAEGRTPRADARRNRERLLDSAVRAFTTVGLDATLDAIARDAGVGIGTLYRHFPTRDALIEAAYRNELTRLCDAVPELLRSAEPDAALRGWMDRYIDYMTTKSGMAAALQAVIDSGGNPYEHSRDRLMGAIEEMLSAGVRAGTLRGDIDATDVFAALRGVSLSAGAPHQRDQAGRLLDLLLAGLRPLP